MDYLWTPWRYQYIKEASSNKPTKCIFCELPDDNNDEENLILHRGKHNYIILNRFPYTNGHSMIVPFRHFGDFHLLSDEEGIEMIYLAKKLQKALIETYNPEGFNIGFNQGRCAGAGVADHLHLHIVPRWTGDSNMVSIIGETRIIPEDLKTTYEKLKKAIKKFL